jgi:hypothetical protein
MRVLHGQVTVLGYIAQAAPQYWPLYAPYNHQSILIDTADPLHADLPYIKRHVTSDVAHDELTDLVQTRLDKKHVAVIALRALVDESDAYQSRALFAQLFEYPHRASASDRPETDAEDSDGPYDPLQLGDMHIVRDLTRVKESDI